MFLNSEQRRGMSFAHRIDDNNICVFDNLEHSICASARHENRPGQALREIIPDGSFRNAS